ncbi:MAG: hypothetical protein FWE20_08975 [Defluviitaleaceae bacterium]|nr:hypothetical protein [Defluviitaleaceae bacterium]
MSIGIGIGGGGAFPSLWGNTTRSAQNLPQKPEFEFNADHRESLSEALVNAMKEWKNRMLKGLNALTEEDIEKKVAELKERLSHDDMTEEELAKLDDWLMIFRQFLQTIAERQNTEALITTAQDPDHEEDRNRTARLIMAQRTHDPLQPRREAEHTTYQSKQMAGRYESMLSYQGNNSTT